MEPLLETYRRREFFGVERFVEAAGEIIGNINENPREGKVIETPTIRTVRYYISEGLLPPATEKRGHSSLFRYPHLLALLLIKWFQVWGIPMSAIQESMQKMSVEQMERAFGQRVVVFTDPNQMTSYIEIHGRDENEDLVVVDDPRTAFDYLSTIREREAPNANVSMGLRESLVESSQGLPSSASEAAVRQPSRHSPTEGIWRRIQIDEGLELNIESQFKVPISKERKKALIQMFEAVLFK